MMGPVSAGSGGGESAVFAVLGESLSRVLVGYLIFVEFKVGGGLSVSAGKGHGLLYRSVVWRVRGLVDWLSCVGSGSVSVRDEDVDVILDLLSEIDDVCWRWYSAGLEDGEAVAGEVIDLLRSGVRDLNVAATYINLRLSELLDERLIPVSVLYSV